eukprot:1002412-Amphidinium_carterae.1
MNSTPPPRRMAICRTRPTSSERVHAWGADDWHPTDVGDPSAQTFTQELAELKCMIVFALAMHLRVTNAHCDYRHPTGPTRATCRRRSLMARR